MKGFLRNTMLPVLVSISLIAALSPAAWAQPLDSAEATSGTIGTCEWEIKDGNLTIRPANGAEEGTIPPIVELGGDESGHLTVPWKDQKDSVLTMTIEGRIVLPKNHGALLSEYPMLTRINGLDKIDTSAVVDMHDMFYGCKSLSSLDLSNFDTSNVTYMSGMFSGCASLESVNLESFDTSKVVMMVNMFGDCSSLVTLDLSNFDTSNVGNMSNLFSGATSLRALDLSSFNTSEVSLMYFMFEGCSSLQSLDLSHFDTSEVWGMSGMFANCSKLKSIDLSSFDTSNVVYMDALFYGCTSLTSLDLASFDTYRCESMNHGNYVTSNNGNEFAGLFEGCSSLQSLVLSPAFRAGQIERFDRMFLGCSSLVSLDLSGFDTSEATSMDSMFEGCSSLKTLDLSNFNTSNVVNMDMMFNNCRNLSSVDVSSFDTSNVARMGLMFGMCLSLESLSLKNFNTSNAELMLGMFQGCWSLVDLDVSSFDTSNATYLNDMFSSCSSLRSLDLSGFDTVRLQDPDAVKDMFEECYSLERVKVGALSTVQFMLPVPDSNYISNADGYWYNSQGKKYLPTDIPMGVADTYYAYPQNGTLGPIPATGVSITGVKAELAVGDTMKLSAVVLPSDSTDIVKWSTSDAAVATVTSSGLVVGVSEGSVTITATAGAQSASADIAVKELIKSVTLSDTAKAVVVGDEPFRLTATVTKEDNVSSAIVWSSSNPTVATVDGEGVVTPLKEGVADIAAKVGGKSASCAVTVSAKNIPTTGDSDVKGYLLVKDSDTAKLVGAHRMKVAFSEKKGDAKLASLAKKAAGENGSLVDAYDISLVDELGRETDWDEPDHSLTVNLALSDAMKQLASENVLGVHHIDDGLTKTTDMDARVSDAEIAFDTTHFSTFVVTATPKSNGSGSTGNNGTVTPQTPATPNDTSLGSDAANGKGPLLTTGDSMAFVFMLCALVALLTSFIAAFVVRTKRKEPDSRN